MSQNIMESDATQTSKVSKYELISQPKLDKFQSQCYSKCSKWWPLVSTQQHRCVRHGATVSLQTRPLLKASSANSQCTFWYPST